MMLMTFSGAAAARPPGAPRLASPARPTQRPLSSWRALAAPVRPAKQLFECRGQFRWALGQSKFDFSALGAPHNDPGCTRLLVLQSFRGVPPWVTCHCGPTHRGVLRFTKFPSGVTSAKKIVSFDNEIAR